MGVHAEDGGDEGKGQLRDITSYYTIHLLSWVGTYEDNSDNSEEQNRLPLFGCLLGLLPRRYGLGHAGLLLLEIEKVAQLFTVRWLIMWQRGPNLCLTSL